VILFERVPRDTMLATHAAKLAQRVPADTTVTRLANVDVVLDLGDTCYITFRGRAFGVPPVAWRVGQKILAQRMAATTAAGNGILTAQTTGPYYEALGRLAQTLWRHARPTGRMRRMAKRLGLLRNPFQEATEGELVQLADFFLGRRMTSTVTVPMGSPQLSRMH